MKIQSKENRILVGISGGLASAVTAALLKSEGFAVSGVYFELRDPAGSNKEFSSLCSIRSSAGKAKEVAEKLNIPLKIVNLEGAFESDVIDYVVHEYLLARKPNPCIPCHRTLKFEALDGLARETHIPQIATGHFARILRDPRDGRPRLYKASEPSQDQSFYLYGISTETLSRAILPLGGITRSMVEKLGKQYSLVPSPGGDRHCAPLETIDPDLIEKRSDSSVRSSGIIRTLEGTVVGEHKGLFRHMIGEKRRRHEADREEYVIGYDNNPVSVIVGPEGHLYRSDIFGVNARWIRPPQGIKGLRCVARTSREGRELPCQVTLFENRAVHVQFDEPDRTLIPGQPLVFNDGDEILGGAIIDRLGPPAGLPKERS